MKTKSLPFGIPKIHDGLGGRHRGASRWARQRRTEFLRRALLPRDAVLYGWRPGAAHPPSALGAP